MPLDLGPREALLVSTPLDLVPTFGRKRVQIALACFHCDREALLDCICKEERFNKSGHTEDLSSESSGRPPTHEQEAGFVLRGILG